MSQDLSETIRTGVTFVLLTSSLSFVLSIYTVSYAKLNEASTMVSANVGIMEQATLTNASGSTITGAVAYRIFSEYGGAILTFEIKEKSGHTYTDINRLMQGSNVAKNFYVNSYQDSSGFWIVKLEER